MCHFDPVPGLGGDDAGASADSGAMTTSVADGLCINGWCWESPTPQGADLTDAWTASATEAWVVGSYGTIMRYDGTKWGIMPTGTTMTLTGLARLAANDVWAVGGNGTILHYDGASWQPFASGTTMPLADVAAFADNDLWVAGGDGQTGFFRHWNGSSWTQQNSTAGQLYRIWASGPGDIWAVSLSDIVAHTDGTTEQDYTLGVGLTGIWGAASNDVWGGSNLGQLVHWDGNAWGAPTGSFFNDYISGIWGTSSSDIWAGAGQTGTMLHYDGATWSSMSVPLGTSAISGTWAVGERGQMMQLVGGTWQSRWSDASGGNANAFYASWGTDAAHVFAIGAAAARRDASSWTPITLPAGFYRGVGGSSATDAWAVGDNEQISHWDGNAWTSSMSGGQISWTGVAATATNAADAVSAQGKAAHWNGTSWTTTPVGGANGGLTAIWASSPSDAWAVGASGGVFHRTASGWSQATSPTTRALVGVWGSAANDIYAIGSGVLIHYDGSTWSDISAQAPGNLIAISGLSASDVWISADTGLWRGHVGAWTQSANPPVEVIAMWGRAADGMWGVSYAGPIFHHAP